jgi:hypothetical protein
VVASSRSARYPHRRLQTRIPGAVAGPTGFHQLPSSGHHGVADETTGRGIVAFVMLREGIVDRPYPHRRTQGEVSREISPIAKPRQITIVPELPRTGSGKIMRRLLKDIAEGRDLGDTSTVDPTVFRRPSSRLISSPALVIIEVAMNVHDRAMLDFVIRWAPYCGADDQIFPEFGLPVPTFYKRVLRLLDRPSLPLSGDESEQVRAFCGSKLDRSQSGRASHLDAEAFPAPERHDQLRRATPSLAAR